MFHHCKTKEEAKKLFKRLALKLHPDCGGESDLMILLQESHEMFAEFIEKMERNDSNSYKKRTESTRSYPGKYQTVYEDVPSSQTEELKIIDEILFYASKHEKFNSSMIESVKEFLEDNGYITSNQYNALVRVYYSFRMDKESR